jgi:hypothetical protein
MALVLLAGIFVWLPLFRSDGLSIAAFHFNSSHFSTSFANTVAEGNGYYGEY